MLKLTYFDLFSSASIVDGHFTDKVPSHQDVFDDFNRMRREFKIRSVSTKWVQRKYAFGAEGVPEGESDYLKVIYDFDGAWEPLCRWFPEGTDAINVN